MLRPLVTGRNEVVAKVIFLHLFVILFTGGGFCLNACWDTPPRTRQTPPHPPGPGRPTPPPPRDQTPPPPPRDLADPPPRDLADPPPGSRLQHRVYERPVRILLECILVFWTVLSTQ